jgi:dihydroorotate dehydrogenase
MAGSGAYEQILRPILFHLDAERAHNLSVRACELVGRSPLLLAELWERFRFEDSRLRVRVGRLEFANPIGLAAGFDKSGRAVAAMASLGFGHVEIGSVSAYPSRGNPKPRLHRLPDDLATIVNYGLPNDGADVVAARLHGLNVPSLVGVNLVKTNDPARPASEAEVFDDYARSAARLSGVGDYVCLNLSCPNTTDGREFFGDVARIDALLSRVVPIVTKPLLLKIKPLADDGYYRELIAAAEAHPIVAGIEINLPPGKPAQMRFNTSRDVVQCRPGSVSGKPVEPIINSALSQLFRILGPQHRIKLVAAGGVFRAEDAYRKIKLGASLVQLYTALVYRGPGLVKEILEGLVRLLDRDGDRSVVEAIGAEAL